MQLADRTLNLQMILRGPPYNEATSREQNIALLSSTPTLMSPKTQAPSYPPNEPSIATLPPPRTRLTLAIMGDPAREQLIEEMKRLEMPYAHTTQVYEMKNIIVDHYDRVVSRAMSSQTSRHRDRTDRQIKEQAAFAGLSVERLTDL